MGTGAISTEFCHVFPPETTPFAACLAALLIPFFVTLTNLRSKDLTTLPEVLVFPILLAIDHSSRTRVTSLASDESHPGKETRSDDPWENVHLNSALPAKETFYAAKNDGRSA
jgi:hypothetical protein